MKAIFFMIIGAICAYLYLNPGDIDGAGNMLKSGVNQGAQAIVELTE
tara:strand:+ start:731 stop:871 length:141 start_codon:yes stop_codon:yes gene_type:complete